MDIGDAVTKSASNVILISIPLEYKKTAIIDDLSKTKFSSVLFICKKPLQESRLDICKPKQAIRKMNSHSYELIVIFDIYSFDKIYGHYVEYILQFRPQKSKMVYMARMCNFKNISEWIKNCKVVNYTSHISFNVIGYENSKNDFAFEMKLNYKINPFINKQTVVYCATQKNCKIAAEHLLKDLSQLSERRMISLEIDDIDLKNCVSYGIGYINYDLLEKDKINLIDLFKTKKIEILFTCKYVENIMADTIIIKSTKIYIGLKYQERDVTDIMNLCQIANSDANIYIMTTKEMRTFYKKTLCTSHGLDYSCAVCPTASGSPPVPYYNFSSLEHHLHEYILLLILYSKELDYKESLKQSFFYSMIGHKTNELDLCMLVSEIIDYLKINRIILSENNNNKHPVNLDLIDIFLNNDISFDSFIKLVGYEGTEKHILTQLSDLPEIKSKLYSKIKYKKGEELIDKLTCNTELKMSRFGLRVKEYIQICKSIKLITRQNYAKLVYLSSILETKTSVRQKLDYQSICDDYFQSKDLSISVVNDKCTIKANNDKYYHFVVEKSSILLHENHFYNNYECTLEHKSTIHCMCTTDFNSSAILSYENGCLNIVHRYYSNNVKLFALRNKKKSIAENIQNIKRVKHCKGVSIEFTAPHNITLPDWFNK